MEMIDGATSTKTSTGRMVDMMPKATKAVKATKKSKIAKKNKNKKCK